MRETDEDIDYRVAHGETEDDASSIDEPRSPESALVQAIRTSRDQREASEQLSGYDSKLLDLKAKRLSFEEIYDELGSPPGTSPAQIGVRIRQLLSAKDDLSFLEQKSLLLRDMGKVRDIIFEQLESGQVKLTADLEAIELGPNPQWASVMVRLFREVRTTIESMQKDVDSDKTTIREAHARIMHAAIGVMFERFVLRLETGFADGTLTTQLTRYELMEIMADVMPLGFEALADSIDQRDQPAIATGRG